MKTKNLFVLDETDDKAVQLFTDLGVPRNLAKTLMYISQINECRSAEYISQINECRSAEIEQGADLRQPEVSIAMQELRRRGWITKRDLKGDGKGRPIHIYSTITQLSEIMKNIEQEKLKEVQTIQDNISRLKNIIKNR